MSFNIVCLNCSDDLAKGVENILLSEFGKDLSFEIALKDYPSIDLHNLVLLFEKNDVVIFGDKYSGRNDLFLLNSVNPLDIEHMPSCIVVLNPENKGILSQLEPVFPVFTVIKDENFVKKLKERCNYLLMDIKFRKQLQETVNRYSTIVQGMADFVWQADINDTIFI